MNSFLLGQDKTVQILDIDADNLSVSSILTNSVFASGGRHHTTGPGGAS